MLIGAVIGMLVYRFKKMKNRNAVLEEQLRLYETEYKRLAPMRPHVQPASQPPLKPEREEEVDISNDDAPPVLAESENEEREIEETEEREIEENVDEPPPMIGAPEEEIETPPTTKKTIKRPRRGKK